MFDEQAIRLLREKWPNANILAEELFAILTSSIPLTHNGPLEITNNTDGPAITIRNYGGSEIAFRVIRADDPASPQGTPGENRVVTDIGNDGSRDPVPEDEEQGSSAFPGKVVSGSAATYQVDIYENGTAAAKTATVAARIGNLETGVNVPANSWVVVMRLATGAYDAMYFPPADTPGKVGTRVSGRTYNVALYENGQTAAITRTVQATCLQLATGETIPANTWVNVFRAGGTYYFQIPVWLE